MQVLFAGLGLCLFLEMLNRISRPNRSQYDSFLANYNLIEGVPCCRITYVDIQFFTHQNLIQSLINLDARIRTPTFIMIIIYVMVF